MTTRRDEPSADNATFELSAAAPVTKVEPASKNLRILFLGGTGFLGPHQINYALARGHQVSMFNTGRRAGMYGDRVEELIGNRDARIANGLKALATSQTWDIVIDNSGYVPRHVRDVAELLKGRCARYLYTSTVAVYDFDRRPFVDNTGPLRAGPEPATEQVSGTTYAPLKAECDRVVRRILADRATIVRPTYIVGPGDPSARFTYWVERVHRGGDVVCPPGPGDNVDWIDVRDLCQWMIRLAENDTSGVFNAVAPGQPMTREQFMSALRLSSSAKASLHWPSRELVAQLRFPTPMFCSAPFSVYVDSSAAAAAGLTRRSLAETIRDTHDWWRSQSERRHAATERWPSPEQEAAMLKRMRESSH